MFSKLPQLKVLDLRRTLWKHKSRNQELAKQITAWEICKVHVNTGPELNRLIDIAGGLDHLSSLVCLFEENGWKKKIKRKK